MRRSVRVTAIAAACAIAGGALYGTGVATAGDNGKVTEAKHSSEPHNIGKLVTEIDTYYGTTKDANGVYQASPDSAYAKDTASVLDEAKKDVKRLAAKDLKKGEKPAIILDVDDTLLLSLDYEKKTNYTYNSTTWAAYVDQADRPAVPGMTGLVDYANSKGVEVFLLSGLAEAQRGSAVKNLTADGYDLNLATDHVFLKNKAAPPAYLSNCATATSWTCTTVQYKAGTRAYVESLGYDIIGNFGDQYSDLDGGYADETYKIPNPTYFVS
ncbi:MAG: hypothetical protein QOF84_3081 [Streptomyces sp.]|nr:hypothetical protein [Streptomyces sp.]MDX6348291.1 hypothetical protein [Streptomyces sp.]